MKKQLITILGPTGIGKTKLSIKLAKLFNVEIISADSRKIYKELDVGVATPSKSELEEVPHHFIKHKSIFENYTVADYEKEVMSLLENLFKKNDLVLLVGGSGLFINAINIGLDEFPEVDESERKKIIDLYEKEGIEKLQTMLNELDPLYYKSVDRYNPRRLVRAIEVSLSSGKPYSSFLKKRKKRKFTCTKIGLTAQREVLYNRIGKRVDFMIEEGLQKEAESLRNVDRLNSLQTVGYKEWNPFFENAVSLETVIKEIKKNTRRYAKKQITWFKKDKGIHWFLFDEKVEVVYEYIVDKLKKENSVKDEG